MMTPAAPQPLGTPVPDAAYKTPTREEVDRAVALLARPEQRRYFFDKLNNPQWLGPLEERGFFNNPPTPITDNENGTIQFPRWPAAHYLRRMADIREAHAHVFRIARNIPDTDNFTVHADLAGIATHPHQRTRRDRPHQVQAASPTHHVDADVSRSQPPTRGNPRFCQ